LSKDRIKVLITDDSPVVREVLKDMIEGEPDLDIVGEAANGREAVNMAKELCPDIITMDVLMPVMNGLEAVEEIMAYTPTPILVFSSALDDKETDVAFQAIARGFGCNAMMAESLAHLKDSLREAVEADRPTVIEIEDAAAQNW